MIAGGQQLRLFHAPSSYYSTIARLALAEAEIDYEPVYVDIHVRMTQHSPDYARLNPNMSVPTLVTPQGNLEQSRQIAEFAFGLQGSVSDAATRYWIDLHYSFPIEDLTFGRLLTRSRLARLLIPYKLAKASHHLLTMAAAHPDLASAYRARAAVFAERARTFDPDTSPRLAETRRKEAVGLLEQLDGHLADNRTLMVPPTYGVADVVWTVFLARMVFVGMAAEIRRLPALARYWSEIQLRPSFAAADVWTNPNVLRLVGGILRVS